MLVKCYGNFKFCQCYKLASSLNSPFTINGLLIMLTCHRLTIIQNYT